MRVVVFLALAALLLATPSHQKLILKEDPCRPDVELLTETLTPRMSAAEQALFNKVLDNATFYFETGSGGSTYVASTKPNIEKIVVVESDGGWLSKLRTYAPVHKAECEEKRLTMYHVDINGNPKQWGHPLDHSRRSIWALYAGAISLFTSSPWHPTPDVVMIDGRFRVACAMYAFRVVRDDTILMVHDYDREAYKPVELFLDKVEQAGVLAAFRVKPRTETLVAEVEQLLHVYLKNAA